MKNYSGERKFFSHHFFPAALKYKKGKISQFIKIKSNSIFSVKLLSRLRLNFSHLNERSSRPEVFCKKGVLRNLAKFTGKHLCQRLLCLRPATVLKKESLAQVLSSEFCEISKNTIFKCRPVISAVPLNIHIEISASL